MAVTITESVGGVAVIRDGVASVTICSDGEVGTFTKIREALPAYEGEITITPTQETQILSTAGKSVYEDITVNPIPSNYGLITWDGAALTVS